MLEHVLLSDKFPRRFNEVAHISHYAACTNMQWVWNLYASKKFMYLRHDCYIIVYWKLLS